MEARECLTCCFEFYTFVSICFAEKPSLDVTWIKDIVVKVSQDFTFLGLMKGCPVPTVTWFHNDSKVESEGRIQIKV